MMNPDESLQTFVPLKVRKQNGRPMSTAPTGRQLRVRPDQRAGCFSRAA